MSRKVRLERKLKELQAEEARQKEKLGFYIMLRKDIEENILEISKNIKLQKEKMQNLEKKHREVSMFMKIVQEIKDSKEKVYIYNLAINSTKVATELKLFAERAEYLVQRISELEQNMQSLTESHQVLVYKEEAEKLSILRVTREKTKTFLPRAQKQEDEQRAILDKITAKKNRVRKQIKAQSEKEMAI